MTILSIGNYEDVKAGIHGAIALLALICLIYNALALAQRPAPRLGVGVVIYTFLVLWELTLVVGHLQELP